MAKCIMCGKSTIVRGHVKLADAAICTPCFKKLGFKLTDAVQSSIWSFDDIKDGKESMFSRRVKELAETTTETYKVHGISKENAEGHDIQELLSEFVQEEFRDDKLTSSEVKEELEYEDRVYLYPSMDIDLVLEPTEYEGEPAVKVMLETEYMVYEHIGWIPKQNAAHVIEILNIHDCDITGELVGGPFKYLDEDDKVCSDVATFGGRIYISYKK